MFLYETLVIISVRTHSVATYGVDVDDLLVLNCKQTGSGVRIEGTTRVEAFTLQPNMYINYSYLL